MWLRHALKLLLTICILSACSSPDRQAVDKLNSFSYAYHYRNLDSTTVYARRALAAADNYDDGKAEALNNLAFVSILKMDYQNACRQLDSIPLLTDNQVELLIADVQHMRLCQRQSQNKEFYDYHEKALHRMRRIHEEQLMLNDHQHRRMVYASSEFDIVTSTYYYYVGLEAQSVDALLHINPDDEVRTDTAQLLAYYYNVGAGEIITDGTDEEIAQQEFDYLLRCFLLSRQYGYVFWEANSLQALSEHLQQEPQRTRLIQDNLPAMKFLNTDQMPDSLLAGNLAQRSLEIFNTFGDVYQIAGSYRTLAQCYWHINDYSSALICLEDALKNKAIFQAPDLVASIREQLSLVYSALDDKQNSDYNRNVYLDLQDETRQDRYLESRADQLNRSSHQLNNIIVVVVLTIVLVLFLLFLFDWLRRRNDRKNDWQSFLTPLQEWQERNRQRMADLEERYEEARENYQYQTAILSQNKERHIEQRAKVSLVNSVTPLIDRMLHEVNRLTTTQETDAVRQERYQYIKELTAQINDYNDLLTEWIQMRQGQLSLRIESFPLQPLFDIISRNSTSYQMKGIALQVVPTDAVVKADRILTLFMISTLADNARKFTPEGGQVTVSATAHEQYVEVSVEDTGVGMTAEQCEHLFDYKPVHDTSAKDVTSHGFGLVNCKGIIEKYKKVSKLFSNCTIAVESEVGKGSRLFFRLPKGITKTARALLLLLSLALGGGSISANDGNAHRFRIQEQWADSVYQCNVDGRYKQAIAYADSCLAVCNAEYRKHYPEGTLLLSLDASSTEPLAEVKWFRQGMDAPYNVLLSVRNEVAVAALALHQWQLYYYNNKVYTHLFNEMSADRNLGEYCRVMQRSETNKNVAVAILILLLLSILPAYYFIYYRHRLHERRCVKRLQQINELLLSDASAEKKLRSISSISTDHFPEKLQAIVSQITEALHDSVQVNQARQTDIELMEDDCRRVQLDNERYHVVNSVLDNCLSSLKHETMYYPARISQLVDAADIESLSGVARYYRDLYGILSEQATRQADQIKLHVRRMELYGQEVLGDETALHHLFGMVGGARSQEQGASNDIRAEVLDENYVAYTVALSFDLSPITSLLCRQIVRDHGELTRRRGCGITIDNKTIRIILPRYNGKI